MTENKKMIKIVNETGLGVDTKVYTESGECLNDYGLVRIFIHPIDSDSLVRFTLTFDYNITLNMKGEIFDIIREKEKKEGEREKEDESLPTI